MRDVLGELTGQVTVQKKGPIVRDVLSELEVGAPVTKRPSGVSRSFATTPTEKLTSALRKTAATPGAAAQMIAGGVSWIPGGLTTLGVMPFVGPKKAAEIGNKVTEAPVKFLDENLPFREERQEILAPIQKPFEMLDEYGTKRAEQTFKETGNPLYATVSGTFWKGLPFIFGGALSGGKAIKSSTWYRKLTVKERALADQIEAKVKTDLNDKTVGQQVREAWKDPANREALIKKYVQGESAPTGEPIPTKAPKETKQITGMGDEFDAILEKPLPEKPDFTLSNKLRADSVTDKIGRLEAPDPKAEPLALPPGQGFTLPTETPYLPVKSTAIQMPYEPRDVLAELGEKPIEGPVIETLPIDPAQTAAELGIKHNGTMGKGEKTIQIYTEPKYGATFSVKAGEDVKAKLDAKVKEFEAAGNKPIAEPKQPATFREYIEAKGVPWAGIAKHPDYPRLVEEWKAKNKPAAAAPGTKTLGKEPAKQAENVPEAPAKKATTRRADDFGVDEAMTGSPIYQAIENIKASGGLNLDSLKADYGKEQILELVRKRPGLVSKNGAAKLDEIAPEYGFADGDTLLQEILGAKSKKAVAKEVKDQFMEVYGEAYELAKQGFVEVDKKTMTAIDLTEGEKVKIKGKADTFTVKDVGGDVILKDGETLKYDAFDQVPVTHIKKAKGEPTPDWTDIEAKAGDMFDVIDQDGKPLIRLEITEADPYKRFHKAKIASVIETKPQGAAKDVSDYFLGRESGGSISLVKADLSHLRSVDKATAYKEKAKAGTLKSGELTGASFAETFDLAPSPGTLGDKPRPHVKNPTANMFDQAAKAPDIEDIKKRYFAQQLKGVEPAARYGEPQSFTATGGPPGSGKTSLLKMAGIDPKRNVTVNADDVKTVAGMEGKGADRAFHEASSDIANELLDDATRRGFNVVYDSQMTNFGKIKAKIDQVLDKGGDVNLLFVNVSAETSKARNYARNIKGESGRLPPDDVVLKGHNYGLPTFIELYHRYKDNPRVSFVLRDNDIDFRDPVLAFTKIKGDLVINDRKIFDNLMQTDYIQVEGGKKYVRKNSLSVEDLRREDPAIQERIKALTAGKDVQRQAPGIVDRSVRQTASSSQVQESLINPLKNQRGSMPLSPESEIVRAIQATKGAIKEAMPHLENLGRRIYESGKTKFADWFKAMEKSIGPAWKSFIKHSRDIFAKISKPLMNEKGKVGYDINKDDIYKANRSAGSPIKGKIVSDAKEVLADAKKMADEYLGAISTRLGNIDPSLKTHLRRFEMNRGIKSSERIRQVEPMLQKISKMSKEDKADFDLARKNGDASKLKQIIDKYGFWKEYTQGTRKVLNELYEQAKEVGFDAGYRKHFHPRIVKDSKGFLNYFYKQNDWPVIEKAIRAKETELGRYLELDEKAALVNSMLRGYGSDNIKLSKPGQLKEREIEFVTPELNKFYMDSDAALLRYITTVTDAIEARKAFGVKGKDAVTPADTIGHYILDLLAKGKIKPEHESILRDIYTARFNEQGTRGIVGLYKNLSYIDTMGSPISAITQIGDMAWSFYKNGIKESVKAMGPAIRGKSVLTKEQIGIDQIAKEFSDTSKAASAVSRIFDLIGLSKMDNIGKETLINSTLSKARKMDPAKLKKELEPIFEGETDALIKDLQAGRITENVKLYAFNTLADFQPIALSEMPAKYLSGGNGRIFYMLKSFTLKQFDAYRREVFQKISQPGTRIQGMKNLVRLSACFVVANASADVIKGILLNRDMDPGDIAVDNLLRLFGISKFITWKARMEGVGSAAVRNILPPFKLADALSRDIMKAGDGKGLETVQSIPIVGKLYYWWFGKGAKKNEKKTNLRRLSE